MVRSLCLAALLLAGCSSPFAAAAVEGDAAPNEAAAQPDSDAGDAPAADAAREAAQPDAPADAGAPDTDVHDSWTVDAGDGGTDDASDGPDAPDAIPVESGPPTYTAHCVPGTPWQQVCVLGDGGTACNGHRWNCTSDGGDIASEFSPDIGEYLSMCQSYGGTATAGGFCCC